MNEYVIVGDTAQYDDCLIYVCGTSYEHANKVLHRMLNNPTADDKRAMIGHTNFRVETVAKEDCWWNYNCD
jgi:hypothetical protein